MNNLQIQCKKISDFSYEMAVEIPENEVQKAFEQEYRNLQKKLKLPGFRKGKVPFSYIRQNHFSQVQYNTMNFLIETAYMTGLKQENLNPIKSPKLDVQPVKENEKLSFKAHFEVHAQVDVQHYEDFTLKAKKTEPTDEDVSKVIENLRNSSAEVAPVIEDRPCQDGDIVHIDLSGDVEGEKDKVPLQKDISIEIGKGTIFKEIESAIKGLKCPASTKVEVQMPKEHSEFPNKKVLFHVQLKKLLKKVLPELNDEWAQKMKVKSLSELKKEVLRQLQYQKEQDYQKELKHQALLQLVDKNPVTVPPSVLKTQEQHIKASIQHDLKQKGAPAEQIEKYIKDNQDKIDQQSQRDSKLSYLISVLANKLKLEESLEATNHYIHQHLRGNSKEAKNPQFVDSVRWQRTQNNVLQYIIKKSKINTV